MSNVLVLLYPEIVLVTTACALFLLGCTRRVSHRRASAALAMVALLAAFFAEYFRGPWIEALGGSLRIDGVGHYVRLLAPLLGVLLALLSFPTRADGTGNSALETRGDTAEYFGFFLLSVAGLMLVCAANDLIVLFLALELVSIPTYVMVSISRPVAAAQEAGVKYFFLGALSAAIMLLGFSYVFGATGQINLGAITTSAMAARWEGAAAAPWLLLGTVLVLLGLAFKMAAFPLHFYAGDVYEGAATSVTAFLAFVPKAAGVVAVIKVLEAVGTSQYLLPAPLGKMLWVLAAVTMTAGNVLGLLQTNIKRVLAWSSVAHSGYMLVALASLGPTTADTGIHGLLFYLTAYGLMNAGAFGVLMLLPGRDGPSAETFDDIAGQGRQHAGLGLAMAVSCFGLIGLPLTVGFFGKLLLIKPALAAGHLWLVVILVVNAAISAAYYLRIVATMFLRPPTVTGARPALIERPILAAVLLSVAGTLALGAIPPLAQRLTDHLAEGQTMRATP
jgi:NADH-quinone oxidoreductase subunit N